MTPVSSEYLRSLRSVQVSVLQVFPQLAGGLVSQFGSLAYSQRIEVLGASLLDVSRNSQRIGIHLKFQHLSECDEVLSALSKE